RKALRESPRRRPETGFGDRVGEEVRRQLPHPLIDDVDDVTRFAIWQIEEHRLSEKHRRLEVDVEMRIPGLHGRIRQGIDQKFGGVVNETAHGSQDVATTRDKRKDITRI